MTGGDVKSPLSPGFVAVALATPFLIGVVAFLMAGLAAGMGPDAVTALVEQASERRLNPLIAGVLGLAPVLLLLLLLGVVPRFTPRAGWRPAVAWAGLAPVALLELWAHWEVWTTYLPSRTMPGFPHGLELVIVPVFFAPIGALVGVGLSLALARRTPEGVAPAAGTAGDGGAGDQ